VITYWHNPRCSKSRAGLALLQDKGVAVQQRLYLQDPPSLDEIRRVQSLLSVAAVDMMRSKDALFKQLGLRKDMDDGDLLAAMEQNPALIERPIAIKDDLAVIGRPTEVLKALL
jgi:arsenate reductase